MEFVKSLTGHKEEQEPVLWGQMKAVVWDGGSSVHVEHVAKPKLECGTDMIIKVTACSICPGYVTHMCAGEIPGMEKGHILGREAVGIVEQVGTDVQKFKQGDRVVISFVIACGCCSFCKRQEFSSCNRTNESKEFAKMYGGWAPAAIFGGSRLFGNVPGSLAQYVRVPFGDVNCYSVTNGVTDEKAVFAAETATTGLHATELAQIQEGDTVVIWGLGPVGLMTAQWSKLKGARRVIGVDLIEDRLRSAYEKFGVEVVDRSGLSTSELVSKVMEKLPAGGADVTIDACGHAASLGILQKMESAVGLGKESADIMKECMTVARKCGRVVLIADHIRPVDKFPIGHLMQKHLTLRAGQTPVQKYFKVVMDAMDAGEVDPSLLITHRGSLDEAPTTFQHACKKDGGYIKAIIRPSFQ